MRREPISTGGFRFLLRSSWTAQKRSFIGACANYVLGGDAFFPAGHLPPAGHTVSPEFVGICVASSPDPACDHYIIDRLRSLGVNQVRMDYGYDSADNQGARLLNALLDASFDVLLHLVQPRDAAARMETEGEQEAWRDFLVATMDAFGHKVAAVEIGSTVNRRRWAGYTLEGFTRAWEIAYAEARRRALVIAGPNVTDYEPFYTVGLLHLLRQRNQVPDIYTNNLFVERARQPEVFDPSVSGRMLAKVARYNVIKKARQLQRTANRHGVPKIWNSYVTWTLPRIARRVPNVEDKQADYLARYMVLMAASGAMDRVYWGPLISFREGLIDDPLSRNPTEELVTFYDSTYGPSEHYRQRAAFGALRQFTGLVPGSRYLGRLIPDGGLEVHAFLSDTQLVHVIWTHNAMAADLADIYSETDLNEARTYSRDGLAAEERPVLAMESPIYLLWPSHQSVTINPRARPIKGLSINLVEPIGHYYPVRDNKWAGMVVARDRPHAHALLVALHPDGLKGIPREELLRKSRNAIWTIRDPLDDKRLLVVKQPVNLRPHKKLFERFKISKAKRSWSGACELLRRGIQSPHPVAYFERVRGAGLTENWYLCEFHPNQLSVRGFFTAYANGQTEFEGFTMQEFLSQLVPFLVSLHRRGVYFRDLSSGNLLIRHDPVTLSFSLIDTARARFYERPITLPQRISDLKRVCHKLHWEGRVMLLNMYFEAIGRTFTLPYRMPFYLYDLKAATKRLLRGKFRVG